MIVFVKSIKAHTLKTKEFVKTFIAPPDKSITQRAILFSVFAQPYTKTTITNALLGLDCLSTIDCARALGAEVMVDKINNIVEVTAPEKLNSTNLYVGNSGTAMRLLMGALVGRAGNNFILDGDDSIKNRPMARVSNLLKKLGANIKLTNSVSAPIKIEGASLVGTSIVSPIASAQVKSAVLLAGLEASGTTTITEPTKSRDHTERLLQYYGVPVLVQGNTVHIQKGVIKPKDTAVVGDISSAAFTLVLGACIKGASIKIKNVGLNPTRDGILEVLKQANANFKIYNIDNTGVEPMGDISIQYVENLKPFTIEGDIIPRLIDEIPILAVLACFIKGTSVIKNAAELKVKETNRIDTVCDMLTAMGASIEKTNDGFIIFGTGRLEGGAIINARGDHRIAMAAAVAGAASRKGVEIIGAECAYISYPDFYEIFR